MIDYLKEIFYGLKSLFTGLVITIRYFFKPIVTVQYPHETLEMYPKYRGHIQLTRNEETGQPKCIVCGMCQKACPSVCIALDGVKPEGAKGKVLTSFVLDFTKCSLCGLCVEVCPADAIEFSKRYNLASRNRDEYIIDLLKRLEDKKR
jgi:NADH-quinone oxidoreductase subunit I